MRRTTIEKYASIILTVFNILAVGAILLILLYAGGRIFVADQFITPTDSMQPALKPGDRIIVDKTIMGPRIYRSLQFDRNGQELKSWRMRGSRELQRNDIAVFNFPVNHDSISFVINYVYCKRCVALPGDSLSISDGFYRNSNHRGPLGNIASQRRLSLTPDSLLPREGRRVYPYTDSTRTIKNMPPIYIPRRGDITPITPLEGALYRRLLRWELGAEIRIDSGKVYAGDMEIKKHEWLHNYYFMAGDNVMNSRDSRYWGLVPEEYIIGVAVMISYSVDKHSGEYRADRLLKPLNYDESDM